MNLVELIDATTTEEKARTFVENARWPNGISCPRCQSKDIHRFENRKQVRCRECRYAFSVTVGTIFHKSHIALRKWLLVIHQMTESKKGMSALQIKRQIGISYKTAWYMCHRIRNAMYQPDEQGERLVGIIEIDETYVGPKSNKPGRPSPDGPKAAILGMIERNGRMIAKHVENTQGRTILDFLNAFTLNPEVVNTDEYRAYNAIESQYNRKSVNHSLMYSDGDIHVNGVENFWSLLKRGLVGIFHKLSTKHLHRYLNEFVFRFNEREADSILALVLQNCEQKHIKYAELIA